MMRLLCYFRQRGLAVVFFLLSTMYVVLLIQTSKRIPVDFNPLQLLLDDKNQRHQHEQPSRPAPGNDVPAAADAVRMTSKNHSVSVIPASRRRSERTANDASGAADGTQARFVFIVGLEGTGHNLMKDLYKDSPAAKHLTSKKLDLWSVVDGLHIALHGPKAGLLNLHCGYKVNETTGLPVVTDKYQKVVGRLKEIADKVADATATADNARLPFVTIPLNVITHEMASYPQDNDDCRPLKYPNLDLIYKACDDAGVICQHMYLYRDPYSILKSTTKNRGFERYGLKAIHLYITMLKIIYAQLMTHHDKTMGCFGFYDDGDITGEFWHPIRDAFGWTNLEQHREFDEYIKSKYRPPPTLTDEERAAIVPSKYRIYMQSFIKANNNVVNLCRQQLATNHRNG